MHISRKKDVPIHPGEGDRFIYRIFPSKMTERQTKVVVLSKATESSSSNILSHSNSVSVFFKAKIGSECETGCHLKPVVCFLFRKQNPINYTCIYLIHIYILALVHYHLNTSFGCLRCFTFEN